MNSIYPTLLSIITKGPKVSHRFHATAAPFNVR